MRVLQPEDLGQGDDLVIADVVEDAEDDGVVRRTAQCYGLSGAGGIVAFALVVAQHVGAQRAFAGIGPSGLVVGHALRWHQQGGDCVNQRGLARTDVAGEQAAAPAQGVAPHPGVEGAPVHYF